MVPICEYNASIFHSIRQKNKRESLNFHLFIPSDKPGKERMTVQRVAFSFQAVLPQPCMFCGKMPPIILKRLSSIMVKLGLGVFFFSNPRVFTFKR